MLIFVVCGIVWRFRIIRQCFKNVLDKSFLKLPQNGDVIRAFRWCL